MGGGDIPPPGWLVGQRRLAGDPSSARVKLRPLLLSPPAGHFHWVGKLHEIPVTGWAMPSAAWAIAHQVNILAEALLRSCNYVFNFGIGKSVSISSFFYAFRRGKHNGV